MITLIKGQKVEINPTTVIVDVNGVGYELIKLSARSDSSFFNLLKKPGLWLQKITTKQREENMVEGSITALKEVFGDRYEDMVGKEYTAEAIG